MVFLIFSMLGRLVDIRWKVVGPYGFNTSEKSAGADAK
jgi:hypothetical protein